MKKQMSVVLGTEREDELELLKQIKNRILEINGVEWLGHHTKVIEKFEKKGGSYEKF
jgi:hypothetical protein